MQLIALVLAENARSYLAKTGQKNITELSLRDFGPSPRCTSGFTYTLRVPDEEAKYKGKLENQLVTIQITELRPFGNGDWRIQGQIVAVGPLAPK